MGNIIIVGTSWVIAKYILPAMLILGLKPILLYDPSFYSKQVTGYIEQYEHYAVDLSSPEKMYDLIKSKNIQNIVAVTSFADSKIANAIKLGKLLGVNTLDIALLDLVHKDKVRGFIPEYSPKTICFDFTNIPTEEIKKLFNSTDAGIVIKPDYASGALGMFFIASIEDIEKINSHVKSFPNQSWLAQEKINGELFSAEGYVANGQKRILGYSLRDRIGGTETSNHFPIYVNKIVLEQTNKALDSLIKRSDYKNGYFHAEFLSDGKKTYLIDANFGRIGGGGTIEMLASSYSIEPEKILAHEVNIGIFGLNNPDNLYSESVKLNDSLAISFGIENPAKYVSTNTKKDVKSYFTTYIPENTEVESFGKDDYSRIGVISGLRNEVFDDIKMITITTTEGTVKPFYFIRDNNKNPIK